ncbi:Hsp20/alpha crystallin family protein [Desulfogranum japonicum]|uniref:Hsp20/alpha crystallin family protein n=1 Tax=Desulfogranum japonicum TaxID=231447 RepID=UPI0003F96674|nr:Hsp20/alpha crystallin family protein [Desulfogranum japonicum]
MPFIRFTERPVLRNPWAEFERIRKGLDELSRGYGDRSNWYNQTNVYPALNIYEQGDRLLVTAELPGIAATDLNISLESDTLSIQGKRDNMQTEEHVSYHRREIEAGSFSRSLALPVKINPDNVTASLQNGILTITLMKATEGKPRKIDIVAE